MNAHITLDSLSPRTNAIIVCLLYGGDWKRLLADLLKEVPTQGT